MAKKILGFTLAAVLIWLGMGGAAPPPGPPPVPSPPPPPAPAPQTVYRSNLPGFFDPYYGFHYSLKVISADPKNQRFTADIGGSIVRVQTDSKTLFYRLEEKHGKREYFNTDKFFTNLKPNQLIWLQGEDTQKRIFSIQTPTSFFQKALE